MVRMEEATNDNKCLVFIQYVKGLLYIFGLKSRCLSTQADVLAKL